MSGGSDSTMAEYWAQLVCVTDTETPPIMIGKDKFTVGRAQGCDVCHENNKLVSGTHCYIMRDKEGKVWLYDSSTNGTLLNSKIKMTKGERREITHGDEFFVVYKKGEDHLNIGYVFQDLVKLKEEEEQDSDLLDQTEEYDDGVTQADATIPDDRINVAEEEEPKPVKRKSDQKDSPTPPVKRAKSDAKDDVDSTPSATSTTTTTTDTSKTVKDETDTGKEEKGDGAAEVTKSGVLPADTEASEKEKSEGGKSEGKETQEKDDAFAETLTCIICQELLHDCISLQPCMHSFCAGCYSDWMSRSALCPSCRSKVDRINKNHIVNNLVEAYLKEHPEKRRPEEDIKELEAKNKITRDMLYPKTKRRDSSDYSGSDDEDDDDDDDSVLPLARPSGVPAGGVIFGFGTPVFGAASNAYRAVCRQCPGSSSGTSNSGIIGKAFNAVKNLITGSPAATTTNTNTTTTTATTAEGTSAGTAADGGNNDGEQPSTSGAGPSGDAAVDRDAKVMPTPPAYECRPNQNHVMCQCCLQIFPDRRAERHTNPDLPAQQCTICYRAFCHAYWGCRKVDCNGCLTKFKDMKFGKKVLAGLILDNPHESDIFKNYLESEGLAVQDVLDTCLAKMAEGTYTCPDQARYNMTGETPLCYACALRNFKYLAYQYRYDIPRDKLPAEVIARPNCYWGKNCRTQKNRPTHAQRFNHICDQIRS